MEVISLLSQVVEVAGKIQSIEPKDWLHVYSLRWAVYEALQTMLDACSMIIAGLGLRKPSSYTELADIIAEAGLLSSDEAAKLKSMAKIRNRIAHTYRRLDLDELKTYGNEVAGSLNLALKLIEEVRKRNIDPPTKPLETLTPIFENWNVALTYLFGSRAKGLETESSDWDIALLFDEEPEEMDRLQAEIAKAIGVSEDKIDLIRLSKADLHLKFRIIKEGKVLYESKPGIRAKFEAQTLIEYLDARGMYEVYLNRLLKKRMLYKK
ncbi:MAG: HepT-like ribonuclease domain-containing protein [Candidatus Bathyarchaeia archaeon]